MTMKTRQLKTYGIAAKAVLRGKFIAMQSYPKKQEKHLVDNLTTLKTTGKEEPKKTPKLVEGKKS